MDFEGHLVGQLLLCDNISTNNVTFFFKLTHMIICTEGSNGKSNVMQFIYNVCLEKG